MLFRSALKLLNRKELIHAKTLVSNPEYTDYRHVAGFINNLDSRAILNLDREIYSIINAIPYDAYYYFLRLFFFKEDNSILEKLKKFEREIALASWGVYKLYPHLAPSLPQLSKPSSEQRKNNLFILKQFLFFDEFRRLSKMPADSTILDEIELVNYLGGGAFGKVFETKDGHAFKIFSDGVDLESDMKRMDKVLDQVYKGSASLEDMHYFDKGEIGNSGMYYAIMPVVIPLTRAPFVMDDPVLSDLIDLIAIQCKRTARYFHAMKNQGTQINDSYERYRNQVFIAANYEVKSQGLEESFKKYQGTLEKVIKAAYRAYSQFGGIDLHAGNLGYFRSNPDVFFYYDM